MDSSLLISTFGTDDLGEYPDCLDKYAEWTHGKSNAGAFVQSCEQSFLDCDIPTSFLIIYFYLKEKVADEAAFNSDILYILTDLLRPYAETNRERKIFSYGREVYYRLLLQFVLDQLKRGPEGLKIIQYYSYYDGFHLEQREFDVKVIVFDDETISTVSGIKEAFFNILRKMPSEDIRDTFPLYALTVLSRIISPESYREIVMSHYEEEKDFIKESNRMKWIKDGNYVELQASIIQSMEIDNAKGDREFYSEEHLKKTIRQFTRCYMNAVEDDDSSELKEAKRLAGVIADSYKYQERLIELLDNERRLTEPQYAYIRKFFVECMEEYLQNHIYILYEGPLMERKHGMDIRSYLEPLYKSNKSFLYPGIYRRNKLCLYLGLYDYFIDPSTDPDECHLLIFIEEELFGAKASFSFLHASQKIEIFWFLAYTGKYGTLKKAHFCMNTMGYFWNELRLLMELNEVTDKSIFYISRLIFSFCHDAEYPVVPYIMSTLNYDHLRRVLTMLTAPDEANTQNGFNRLAYISLIQRVGNAAVSVPGGSSEVYGDRLLWTEAFYRLRLINYSSLDALIDEFILMANWSGIEAYYFAPVILAVADDIAKKDFGIDKKTALMRFIESATDVIDMPKELPDRNRARLIFNELQKESSGLYITKIVLFTRYALMNFLSDGLEMIRMFSKVDVLSTHNILLNQSDRIGAFRLANVRHDNQLNEEMGPETFVVKKVSDDLEDQLLLLNSYLKKVIEDSRQRGADDEKITDIYFDTYLSCFIRLDAFNSMMKESYGDDWDINRQIKRRGGLRRICRRSHESETSQWYRDSTAPIQVYSNVLSFAEILSDEFRANTPEEFEMALKGDFSYLTDRAKSKTGDSVRISSDIRVKGNSMKVILPDNGEGIKDDDGDLKLIIEGFKIEEDGSVTANVSLDEGDNDAGK